MFAMFYVGVSTRRLRLFDTYELTIVKGTFKEQEILLPILGSHVLQHDLLRAALTLTIEGCLSNNMTSGIAISSSCKPDNSKQDKTAIAIV